MGVVELETLKSQRNSTGMTDYERDMFTILEMMQEGKIHLVEPCSLSVAMMNYPVQVAIFLKVCVYLTAWKFDDMV